MTKEKISKRLIEVDLPKGYGIYTVVAERLSEAGNLRNCHFREAIADHEANQWNTDMSHKTGSLLNFLAVQLRCVKQ